jgi:hypothetical protein
LVITPSSEPGVSNIFELVGIYKVSGSVIDSDLLAAYSVKPKDTTRVNYKAHYTLGDGTLSEILPGGNERLSFKRSDSTRNCRPHWRVFTKPSDWDLN